MYMTYDSEVDAAYIYFDSPSKNGHVEKTLEISQYVYMDFGKKGKILGLEVLDARSRLDKKLLKQAVQIGKKKKIVKKLR